MSSDLPIPPDPPCACGSGLRASACCRWTPGPSPSEALIAAIRPMVLRAAEALDAGAAAEAETLCLAVLNRVPGQTGALGLLARIRRDQGRPATAATLLHRLVVLDPANAGACHALATLLHARGALAEAEPHARMAVRLLPREAAAHHLLAMILTDAQRAPDGEFHYRRVLALLPAPDAVVLANLGWNLKTQGRLDQARRCYRASVALDPAILPTLLGWARTEEAGRDLARAGMLLDRAERLAPLDPGVLRLRAVLCERRGDFAAALATLDRLATRPGEFDLAGGLERGRILDRLGRFDAAFAAFAAARRQGAAGARPLYRAEEAAGLARRLTAFFDPGRIPLLPRAGPAPGPQPIFILGFPRSGTTLVEQSLSRHPLIAAGDELPLIPEIAAALPRLLNSPWPYPEALAELWLGDQCCALDGLRDHYLRRARQFGAVAPGPPPGTWFTDKMPLNETHLGLITLLFPASPLVHVLRHPLDVVLSVFSHDMTHGLNCAQSLETAARHYALTADLVEHYLTRLKPRYLPVRYEDIVADGDREIRRLLDFLGLAFEPGCLAFHDNPRPARTASYAQVTEKLHAGAVHRHRHYRDHLAPIIPILRPAIERLGYGVVP